MVIVRVKCGAVWDTSDGSYGTVSGPVTRSVIFLSVKLRLTLLMALGTVSGYFTLVFGPNC